MKNMRELINLMEGVIAVPGLNEKSTSEKQARFMAAAAHNPGFAKKAGIDQSVAKEFNKADTGTKQLSNAMKEDESDMQTAGTVGRNQDYAEFDASQTPATEGIVLSEPDLDADGNEVDESVPAVDSCQQSNAANADEACAMEEGVSDLVYNQQHSRFSDLMNSYVEPQEAFDVISREMSEQGIDGEEHDAVMQRLESDFFPDDSAFDMNDTDEPGDGMTDAEADADTLASAGWGTDEDYGDFGGNDEFEEGSNNDKRPNMIDPEEVKAMISLPHDAAKTRAQEILASTRTSDEKKAYLARQINASRNTMAVIKLLYDMILKGEGHGVQGSAYSRKFDNAMEEAFNLQNGYDDINDASGNDYFPNGADSPVVKATGPSGARQGDNPEQKKMQVAEVHKELVYGYRDFLKESAETKKKS
jgi:hypothetical protein